MSLVMERISNVFLPFFAVMFLILTWPGKAHAQARYNASASYLRTGTFVAGGSDPRSVALPSNSETPGFARVGISANTLNALGAGNTGKSWATASAAASGFDPGGPFGYSESVTIGGSANFSDRITFTPEDPARNGQSGFLEAVIGVTNFKVGNVSLDHNAFVDGNLISQGLSSGEFPFTVPIVFGQPISVFFSVSAGVEAAHGIGFSDPPRDPAPTFINRGYTAVGWRRITKVTDANGNPAFVRFGDTIPPGATFVVDVRGDSGADYRAASEEPEIILPEPASLGLFAAAALFVLARRCRR